MIGRIEITDRGADEDSGVRQRILDVLIAQAATHGQAFSRRDILLEAREGGAFAGGLSGKLGRAFLVVELLAVEEAWRGRGVGRALMERAEAIAREAGASGVWVDTFTFQAPGFYQRLGYSEFGRITDYMPGHDRVFFVRKF